MRQHGETYQQFYGCVEPTGTIHKKMALSEQLQFHFQMYYVSVSVCVRVEKYVLSTTVL